MKKPQLKPAARDIYSGMGWGRSACVSRLRKKAIIKKQRTLHSRYSPPLTNCSLTIKVKGGVSREIVSSTAGGALVGGEKGRQAERDVD